MVERDRSLPTGGHMRCARRPLHRLVSLACLLVLVACSPASAPTPTVPALSPTSVATPTGAPPTASPTILSSTPTVPVPTPTNLPPTPTAATVATATVAPSIGNAPPTPSVGAALVEEAVTAILDHYVDRLDSATVYLAAYDGTLAAVRMASGVTDQAARPTFGNDQAANAVIFRQAYLVLASANPTLDQSGLAYATIRAMVAQIHECHTNFFDPAAAHRLFDPSYAGIGMNVIDTTLPTMVGVVFPDSPAQRSGLKAGDLLLAIDGVDVTALHAEAITPLVVGPEGTTVRLTIQRPGESAPRTFAITRARITPPVLTSRIATSPSGAKIGYLKLYRFPDATSVADDMRTALIGFEQAGVTGWVLDLRGNPGGNIRTLRRIGTLFLGSGRTLAYTVQRDGVPDSIVTDAQPTVNVHRPLAVLIDKGSESSSEMLAAALEDYGAARVFGMQSGGCVGVAMRYPLADASVLLVTVSTVQSAERHTLNGVGVTPDEIIATDPAVDDDAIPDAVLRWLASQ